MRTPSVGVVGATGAVGGVLLGILRERGFDDVRLFASARSAGRKLDGRPIEEATPEALEAAGVEVVVASGSNEAARVESALDELGARGVQSLLLEGGPRLAGAFLEAGEVDEARIFIAPLLAGGREARTAVEGMGIERIAAAPRALHVDVERIDDDVLVVARLRDW